MKSNVNSKINERYKKVVRDYHSLICGGSTDYKDASHRLRYPKNLMFSGYRNTCYHPESWL